MTFLHAVILGMVEGITEFLPISSTGHLILVGSALRIESTEAVRTFDIAIQLGGIGAAVLLYSATLFRSRRVCLLVLTAFLPTAVIGFLMHDLIKRFLLGSTSVTLWALFLGGLLLLLFEWIFHRRAAAWQTTVESMTYRQAFIVGCAQSLALIPGVSRSAATIVGGMLLGISRGTIIEFSFMLAIPTMLAATGLDLLKSSSAINSHMAGLMATGFIAALITASVAIRWLLRYLQHHTFVIFGVYRVLLAGLLLALSVH